ncbi:NAD(P)/FAD-dependent oxidoreductase [Sneathiella limimaris]|uniref:NAD(P)/FAD-dependent oxidoreductase n=1 Tax=Sneathiella limimaris TaxID=1964213 RepID=UPI00146A656C|nr:FAD-dependent oxidoreductase [Sneathiella limimaris]
MKTTPYWWEAAPREEPAAEPLPEKAEVVVIGSGFTGLAAALVVARSGHDVLLLEAGRLGEGASSRNGGMVGPSFHKLGIKGLKANYGETIANEILKESVGFVDFLANFLTVENISADFKQTGRFRGALRSEHYASMARELEALQKACGVKGHMVSPGEQHLETGSSLFHGGVVYELDGGLHPAKYHAGLLQTVQKAGVRIQGGTPVEDIRKENGRFLVVTPSGVVTTEKVAVCTNGYTGKALPDFRKRVLPLRSAILVTEELQPEQIERLMPQRRMYGDSRRLVAYYRTTPDNKRILFGGRASGYKDRPAHNLQILKSSMAEVYPELSKVETDYLWSGLVAYTFDHSPHIGNLGDLYYAMGYCGSGVARSTYFGTKLGYKIIGDQENGRTAFDDLPFEGKFLYSGNPWFMPGVLLWQRIADRLGL